MARIRGLGTAQHARRRAIRPQQGAPVEELEYFPHLETQRGSGNNSLVAPATLVGGSFVLPRRVRLNRVIFRTLAFTAPAEGVVLIYQEAQGRVVADLPLVATCSFTPAASTTFQIEPDEGEITLSNGIFYALWGQVSGAGSFSLRTYNSGSIDLLTSSVPSGVHPLNATSALNPAAPPTTIDQLVGGDLVAGVGADVIPILRFRKV